MAQVWPEGLSSVLRGMPETGARIMRIDLGIAGQFWVKRAERASLRIWLQKGNPRRALETERRALHLLADGGLPVATVVAEGADFLVVPDLGPTLDRMLLHRTPGLESAFAAAGGALARLHRAGYAHGRPALRDICWDGHEARLIDLENFDAGHSAPWRRAMDVVVLAQTHFTQAHDMPGPLALAIDAYRAGAGPQAWAAVQRLARLLVPLGWLAAGLYRLRPISRELRAVPLALAFLRARS